MAERQDLDSRLELAHQLLRLILEPSEAAPGAPQVGKRRIAETLR